MTALSTSKVKVVDRKTLYFGKFSYKVDVRTKELYYTHWARDINEYREQILERVGDQDRNRYAKKIDPGVIDYPLVEKYLNFKQKYKNNKNLVGFRNEGDVAGIYTNDLAIINEVLAFSPKSEVVQVNPMPTGVMYFKRTPPANYRVYCKNSRQTSSTRQDIVEYLQRTPDLSPNKALARALSQTWPNMWTHDGQYIDYNDDRNLVMMHLMFPGILGKSYKLEKK
jgi:hypothetical protein